MLTAWFLDSGTTGYAAIIRDPPAYNGNWGPGTFVTTRFHTRRVSPLAARAPIACSVGGAKPVSPTIAWAPNAWPLALSWPISNATRCSLTTGSGSPTGRSHRNAATWLPADEESESGRILTGTMARIVLRGYRFSPRVINHSRNAPAMTANTTSLIVPPCALRMRL